MNIYERLERAILSDQPERFPELRDSVYEINILRSALADVIVRVKTLGKQTANENISLKDTTEELRQCYNTLQTALKLRDYSYKNSVRR